MEGWKTNRRQKKKKCKDCSACKYFEEWDYFSGQYDEYGRCELPSYVYPICKFSEILEYEYDLSCGGDFREQIKDITGKAVCRHWERR